MTDEKKDQECNDESSGDLSRRNFVALSLAAGLSAASHPASGAALPVIETDVEIKTPDGVCDAVFIHPTKGAHPGVLIWPDSLGLRPAMRQLGQRIAAEGYAVLVPNHLYRMAKAPVYDDSFDYANNPADREQAHRLVSPFLAPGAAAARRSGLRCLPGCAAAGEQAEATRHARLLPGRGLRDQDRRAFPRPRGRWRIVSRRLSGD